MGKRIAIVGAGAVGGYVAGYIAKAGEDLTIIDPWPAHVEAIKADGLQLTGLTNAECFAAPARALQLTEVQDLSREAPIDIAFVCTKSYDTQWATALISQYLRRPAS